MSPLQQINDITAKGPAGLEEADRAALLQAAQKLVETLENPFEKIIRLTFGIYDPISLRLAIDMNLADIALAHRAPISLEELAEKSKTDLALLQRVLRMLIPLGVFVESEPSKYAVTPFTPVLATGSPAREAIIHFTHVSHSTVFMPEYFEANGYKNPNDSGDTPFSFGERCPGETYFDFLAKPENARLSHAFNQTMTMQRGDPNAPFPDGYPAQDRLKIDDPERVLFVDVGGGIGHQVQKFHEKYPSLSGKLALEDLPQVLEKANDLPSDFIKVGHDFFTPQPDAVKNAKAFYFRTVLHDWPEKQSVTILKHIADVMADDSVILIHEIVLPESGVTHLEAKIDLHMLNLGALERTEKQWRQLAALVGLDVNGIWMTNEDLGRRGIIELGKKK
ncbi:S-adenosyl-L-methionine-dependent methyltransferase [Aaosphaeria arxii CBS 175.79]|uniref:S-adenosyl-L-methionine-dependent methyltransferase n=1 Tax=Aaosphaeria arxii CBS 175.79 TaxID=1450172 RepID=A0A6A5Y1U4_9PLEO|nr:S-adenosyl-L-methionine-dependent methyltransferase [Aaosphaeria arxii CBS 175.79]KAF2019189.1 S-adenosyl-L-methionine-dependent methyltransferase [Aaosphaeria arxii CBS 175.79]